MKFRMAPNSLFAILLRSPWWVSLLPAAAIGLASRALLPDAYVIFGAMGAIPFVVIAVIAARRQWALPSEQESAKVMEQLSAMGWRDFCAVMQAAYGKAGFQVTVLNGDSAADLQLQREGRSTLVACRRWKAANLGAEPLRQLASARRERDISRCVFVSLLPPAEATQRVARKESVELLNGVALVAMVRAVMPGTAR